MPRKINVVNLEKPEEQPVQDVPEQEEPVQEEQLPQEIVVSFDSATEVKTIEEKQPKKRASPKKKVKEEVQPEVVQEEEIQQPLKKEKVIKTVELVKCDKCDKLLSSKSLRYSHNCEEKPVKRREPKIKVQPVMQIAEQLPQVVEPVKLESNNIIIPEDVLQKAIEKKLNEERDKKLHVRKEKIQKLVKEIV